MKFNPSGPESDRLQKEKEAGDWRDENTSNTQSNKGQGKMIVRC
jgi:hypothetical protein